MGVFTTQTLLSSVGISRNRASASAVAINWILKDGAGRVGKMIFSRQGKKFDSDLKQLMFSGDLLMELGACVELATSAVPHLFLPLACAANVLKDGAGRVGKMIFSRQGKKFDLDLKQSLTLKIHSVVLEKLIVKELMVVFIFPPCSDELLGVITLPLICG